ncbi:hypothetical protein [Stenotrophomonas maltophilia]|jgi:hypothetical protein|uniref:hypothetical protein n=2 Tax=Stenotrophomonas TaxID=40323 RepID=UPI00131078D0|nr:hypothetical protein [Stenotrophomonas maltophilia]
MLATAINFQVHNDRELRRSERVLGNRIAEYDSVSMFSIELVEVCKRYLSERANELGGIARAGKLHQLTQSYLSILRPIPLPFAGRLRNIADLHLVLSGSGSIRELQATVWRTICFVLFPDLIAGGARSKAARAARNAGLDVDFCLELIEHAKSKLQRSQLLSHREVLCPPADPIKFWQSDTRIRPPDLGRSSRCWSGHRRTDFLREGGAFSGVEIALRSPRGEEYVPWLDGARLVCIRSNSVFAKAAAALQEPVITGPSNTAADMMKFARILGADGDPRLTPAAIAYLLPTGSHSLFEVLFGLKMGAAFPDVHELAYWRGQALGGDPYNNHSD